MRDRILYGLRELRRSLVDKESEVLNVLVVLELVVALELDDVAALVESADRLSFVFDPVAIVGSGNVTVSERVECVLMIEALVVVRRIIEVVEAVLRRDT